jgi:hypothetical protein
MAHLKNRRPIQFTGCAHKRDTGPRFENLSKADWADVFCDLYQQVFGETARPEDMLADAERRVALLKRQRP